MAKKRRTELDVDIGTDDIPAPAEAGPPSEPEPSGETSSQVEESPSPKINKAKLAMVAGGGTVLLVITIILIYGIAKFSSGDDEQKENTEIVEKIEPEVKVVVPQKKVVNQVEGPPLYELKPFIVPISGGTLVRIELAVEMSGDEVIKEIDRNLVLIRENIYFLLKTKSKEAFLNEMERRKIATDIAIAINRSIQSGAVTKTLVTNIQL